MTQRIVLVTHDDGSRADRASRYLVARGHAVEWSCPAQGGGLPIAVMLLLMGYGMAKTLHEDFPLPDVEDKMALRYLQR